MLTEHQIDKLSHTLTFWHQLNDSQKELLLSNSGSYHYKKGTSLHFGENDCIGLLFIEKGCIRTYILSDEGREVTLFRLDDNDLCILSASCVLKTITFDVHINTETDCDIIQINSIILAKLIAENIYVENFSNQLATERFSDVMWAMQQILFTSFDKRLAAFLIDETTKSKTDTLHMTHEQIARYMGSAREVVSRMLNYFSKEGFVSLSRGDIKILDKKKLRELV